MTNIAGGKKVENRIKPALKRILFVRKEKINTLHDFITVNTKKKHTFKIMHV